MAENDVFVRPENSYVDKLIVELHEKYNLTKKVVSLCTEQPYLKSPFAEIVFDEEWNQFVFRKYKIINEKKYNITSVYVMPNYVLKALQDAIGKPDQNTGPRITVFIMDRNGFIAQSCI